ncbi:hypothetical protein ACWIGM_20800 [Bosea sp. NPDC055332]
MRVAILESLTQVGPSKPIGYLPLNTIRSILNLSVQELIDDARKRGIAAIELSPRNCCINSGALYFYDSTALIRLLDAEAGLLCQNNCPRTPREFVEYIARNWLEPSHPLTRLVRHAFGENDNGRDEPGRHKIENG